MSDSYWVTHMNRNGRILKYRLEDTESGQIMDMVVNPDENLGDSYGKITLYDMTDSIYQEEDENPPNEVMGIDDDPFMDEHPEYGQGKVYPVLHISDDIAGYLYIAIYYNPQKILPMTMSNYKGAVLFSESHLKRPSEENEDLY